MTDTPIYDQISRELRATPAGTDQVRRSRAREQGQSAAAVSVWALIDEHRGARAKDVPGRRRP